MLLMFSLVSRVVSYGGLHHAARQVQGGGARLGPAAGVAGVQGIGDGLVNRSRRGFGGVT